MPTFWLFCYDSILDVKSLVAQGPVWVFSPGIWLIGFSMNRSGSQVQTLQVYSYVPCCTKGVQDSLCESNVVAGWHEQTAETDLQDYQLARV